MRKIFVSILLIFGLLGCSATKEYRTDPDTLYYVVELTEQNITLAPKDYKPTSHDEFESEIIEMPIASKISYYDTTVNVTVDESGQNVDDIILILGTVETIEEAIEVGCPYVYVECNDENEIYEVILIGELVFK